MHVKVNGRATECAVLLTGIMSIWCACVSAFEIINEVKVLHDMLQTVLYSVQYIPDGRSSGIYNTVTTSTVYTLLLQQQARYIRCYCNNKHDI